MSTLNVDSISVHDLREGAGDTLGAVQVLVTVTADGEATLMQLIWQNDGDGVLYLCGDEVEHDWVAVGKVVGADGNDVWAVREKLSALTTRVQAVFDNWRDPNVPRIAVNVNK